ncbi:MAG: DUF1549 and DUF1553 domain-containing protein [Pirellulales bacterium]
MEPAARKHRWTQFARRFVIAGLLYSSWVTGGARASDHWAFQRVEHPPVPNVGNSTWPANPIDSFVLARLKQERIDPSPEADPVTLLRRVTLDLTGLPPTPSEVDEFASESSPEAFARVVDRLLESSHYGERWARHWLDVARYADSAGHEFDTKRDIWKYRDWVIQAFNHDKPYNDFLIEQLAGDLLPNATEMQKIATGFSCNALKQYGDNNEATIDRVNAYGTAYLGLTLGCAQCHDHVADPISQAEYYQFFAFFNQAEDSSYDFSSPEQVGIRDALLRQVAHLKKEQFRYRNGPDKDPVAWAAQLTADELRAIPLDMMEAVQKRNQDRTEQDLEAIRQQHAQATTEFQHRFLQRLQAWMTKLTDEERQALNPAAQQYLALRLEERPPDPPQPLLEAFWQQDAGYKKRQEVIEMLQKSVPETETTLVMRERLQPVETHIFVRGEQRNKGEQVEPGVPAFMPPLGIEGRQPNRLDLARWSTARDNPLPARVMVNRIWQHYFGIGLVESSDNFGLQGDQPSHPQLLDWLAVELMENGWRLKHIHRLIVTSSTYRQSSRLRPELAETDPHNRLLARQKRIRLEAEIIRDVALASSGILDPAIGGPSVFPYQPPGIMDARADQTQWVMSDGNERFRRGLYIHFWRLTPHPYLKMFDAPDASGACARRTQSNTPLQALTLLNDPWFTEAAAALAAQACRQVEGKDEDRLGWMFRASLARHPAPQEQQILLKLLEEQRAAYQQRPAQAAALLEDILSSAGLDPAQLAAWTTVARAIHNLDEFITRE